MVKPPSPDSEIHLPARKCRLRSDRLRHRVGHRAMQNDPISRRLPFIAR